MVTDRPGEGRSECRWARILVFEPPHRVVFSWDISPQWQVQTDPDRPSEVEARLIAESEQRTRVELEHRHLERYGAHWERTSAGVDGDNGLAALPRSLRSARQQPGQLSPYRRLVRSPSAPGTARAAQR